MMEKEVLEVGDLYLATEPTGSIFRQIVDIEIRGEKRFVVFIETRNTAYRQIIRRHGDLYHDFFEWAQGANLCHAEHDDKRFSLRLPKREAGADKKNTTGTKSRPRRG